MDSLFVYGQLVGAQIRGQMQYRVSFLLQLVGSFSIAFSELLAVLILFRTFGEMAGWRVGEVALLYGLVAIGFGISELVSEGFDEVSVLIRMGEFDRVLTRPVQPFLQVLLSGADWCRDLLLDNRAHRSPERVHVWRH